MFIRWRNFMIARRVKPGLLKIINAPFEGMIESYTLLDVSKEDAAELLFVANSVKKEEDGSFTISYEDSEPVSRMYKAIAHKHKQSNPDFIDVSMRYELDMDAIPGTSVLVRDPNTQTIKIAYRKSTNYSKVCGINRLFVTNATREAFFKDVVHGAYYKRSSKFILGKEDAELYSKWSNFMNERYFEIVAKLKEGAKGNGE